jgi:hypothetical protein
MTNIVYLRPFGDEDREAPLMEFRLTYEGELRASGRDPVRNQSDRLAQHKQKIRKVFHSQLKELWRTNRFLSTEEVFVSSGESEGPKGGKIGWANTNPKAKLVDYVASQYEEFGYRFCPLVRESTSLMCSLRILFLRRDVPGSVIHAGDLDNRIKTLIDTLRRPQNAQELREFETPSEGENPFFCLLEDDKLVSSLSVDTDTLLDPITGDNDADQSRVKIVITVAIRPYHITMNNLSFS